MSVHLDLEAAYKDLESLNIRLMAFLEDNQAEADAERCKRADALAELAMARATHETELERVTTEGQLLVQQTELEFKPLLKASQCQLDEAEARAAQCQVFG